MLFIFWSVHYVKVRGSRLPIPMSSQPQPPRSWFACILDVCEDKDAFQISMIKGN